MRSIGALVGDLVAVLVFVAVGISSHGEQLSTRNLLIVAWPFAVGMLIGHLAVRSWHRPFALWPQGVFIWAITVAAGMALRTLFSLGVEPSFVAVTAAVLAVLMLGWRGVALFLTRTERQPQPSA